MAGKQVMSCLADAQSLRKHLVYRRLRLLPASAMPSALDPSEKNVRNHTRRLALHPVETPDLPPNAPNHPEPPLAPLSDPSVEIHLPWNTRNHP